MPGHVFVVASGYGLRIIPKGAPYRFEHAADHAAIDVERDVEAGSLFARVIPDGRGGYTSRIAQGTESLYDVADVVEGPDFDTWWLETTGYRVPLPLGWRAEASGDAVGGVLFDLVRGRESIMFIRTPRQLPALADLVAPEQKIVDSGVRKGASWCRIEYLHEGRPWMQVHELTLLAGAPFAVTGQAPASESHVVMQAVSELMRRACAR